MYIQPSKSIPLKSNADLEKLERMVRNRWRETWQAVEARANTQTQPAQEFSLITPTRPNSN